MTDERTVNTSTRSEHLVAADVFIHGLSPFTLEMLRRATEQGLTLSGLDFTGDGDSVVILRFSRAPLSGKF